MSAYTITVKDTAPNIMVRRSATGELLREESDRSGYIVPPAGEYTLRITSFSEQFEMPVSEQYGGGTKTSTRVEFEILSDRGKGKRFTDVFTWSVGEKSNLGQLLRRAGVAIPTGTIDLAQLLLPESGSVDFVGLVKLSATLDDAGRPKYASVVASSVRKADAAAAAYDPFAAA